MLSIRWVGHKARFPGVPGSFSSWPPAEPGVQVSLHRALQWLSRESVPGLLVADVDLAGVADHEGLTSSFHHDVHPLRP